MPAEQAGSPVDTDTTSTQLGSCDRGDSYARGEGIQAYKYTCVSGNLHYIPYHDSGCSSPFSEGAFEATLLGIMASAMHQRDLDDGDYSGPSTASYASYLRDHCTFNAPFRVTGSCVNLLSCNFDGQHIYLSGRTSYTPTNVCSRTPPPPPTSRRRSASYSSYDSSYTPPPPSYSGYSERLDNDVKAATGIMLVLYILLSILIGFFPCWVFCCAHQNCIKDHSEKGEKPTCGAWIVCVIIFVITVRDPPCVSPTL